MGKNLVIVESPKKAKTIEKFLGGNYTVKPCRGHIRDLEKSKLGIDVEHDFKPDYVISNDKIELVEELLKASQKAEKIYLASDEDREGEAIAWHLMETLNLNTEKTQRIAFHEITKHAILEALQNPRQLDMNLVEAQQARRIIDRIVGYEISPILWKKIKPRLSAGRVQSVAVRLIVEREDEIMNHKQSSLYRVEAIFKSASGKKFKATLADSFPTKEGALQFLKNSIGATYSIENIESKMGSRTPSAPFTTSTLQQEASRKLGLSVSQTMSLAQRLYEDGLITYMRTDSTHLANVALASCQKVIKEEYGDEYAKTRQYATKVKGAQEAHEAIRPTFVENEHIEGTAIEKRLYDLIRKRTLASQMADAKINKTTITINSSNVNEKFIAIGESVVFDGFIKLYHESSDEEDTENQKMNLPKLNKGSLLNLEQLSATERFNQHHPRYSEASLVKKMEEIGVGRPSTYAPTISTIIAREYVIKEDRPGYKRNYTQLSLNDTQVTETIQTELVGAEKAKLFPSDMGIMVNKFLVEYFPDIVDYSMTAHLEEELDKVANGNRKSVNLLKKFYPTLKENVEDVLKNSRADNGERVLGTDPQSGKVVKVRIGRFGPMAQIGETTDKDVKYAGLKKGQLIANITLDEVLQLFRLPRVVGEFEGKDMTCAIGRFGPYIRHNGIFVSLEKTDDPYTITEARAIELIEQHRIKETQKHVLQFEEEGIEVLRGRFGPYIKYHGANYKIPQNKECSTLTLEDCKAIIAEAGTVSKTTKKVTTVATKSATKAATKEATKAVKATTKGTKTAVTKGAKKTTTKKSTPKAKGSKK